MSHLLAGLLSLAAFTAADTKEDTAEGANVTRAAGILKKLEGEFMAKVRTARTNEASKELFAIYASKFLALASEYRADPVAIDALSFPLRMGPPHDARAVAALTRHHTKSPRIKNWVAVIAIRPDTASQKLLKAIIEDNPDKKVSARAVEAAIWGIEQNVISADQLRNNERHKELLAKALGEQFVKDLLAQAEDAEKLIKGYKKLLDDKFKGVLPEIGKPAPETVCEDLEGNKVKLSDLKGKVVVLEVWTTWCPACRGMIPHSRDLVKKMTGKPFVYVSVSADAQKKTLIDFMKEKEMPWTHWWNGAQGGIVEDWEIQAFPTIFILDAKGIVRENIVGAYANHQIKEVVTKLLEELEQGKKPKSE
jgi:thiol-disulfide isomerase/thioredoxin